MSYVKELIDKLAQDSCLSFEEYEKVFSDFSKEDGIYAKKVASDINKKVFNNKIYLRGLIEFTNFCKNDCLYCGLRISNKNNTHYRLTKEEILNCCEYGYSLGLRTFVLQGGEDLTYSTNDICDIVSEIKSNYLDCAITLSIGEKTYEEYKAYFDAGVDRYLLRHETATKNHYEKLHPNNMSYEGRMRCLKNLKDIGYQVGCGFMVGSPYQTVYNLANDMTFIQEFKPHMVGVGPFIPHLDTPFREYKHGDSKLTIFIVSLLRIMLKDVLLPATTALGSVDNDGRIEALCSGANVIMPNISPVIDREKYMLYNNKICVSEDTKSYIDVLKREMKKLGYEVVDDRGDYKKFQYKL